MKQTYPQKEDDFGTFLASVQENVKKHKNGKAPIRIMRTLSQEDEVKVVKVMSDAKVSWSDFTDGIKYLEDAGLIQMDDDDDGGTVRLTNEGRRWANTLDDFNNGELGD